MECLLYNIYIYLFRLMCAVARIGRMSRKERHDRSAVKRKDWIVQKKERRKQQGKDVKTDSKYTGRKRATKF